MLEGLVVAEGRELGVVESLMASKSQRMSMTMENHHNTGSRWVRTRRDCVGRGWEWDTETVWEAGVRDLTRL